MLDFVDETFDQMTLTVPPLVVFTGLLGTLVRRNDRSCSLLDNPIDQRLSGIAPICNDVLSTQTLQQRLGLGTFMGLSRRQPHAQRITQTVHCDMDFGTEAAATTPQRLLLLFFAFFVRLPRRDERARWWRPAARFPYPGRWRNAQTSAPRRPHHTTVRSVYRRYSSSHTRSAVSAIALRCVVSIERLRQSADTSVPTRPLPADIGAGTFGFSSILRLVVLSCS
jgi:hypothetical protein